MHGELAPGEPDDFAQLDSSATLGARRRALVTRAYRLASDYGVRPADEQRESVPQLAGLLAASLEELRLAEEELRVQSEELASSHAEAERNLAHYRDLFELAPAALLVTDSYGSIREVNRAAVELTGRDAARLLRKPFMVLIPPERRLGFRDGFTRLALTSGADDWRFVIDKMGVEVEVSAIVRPIDESVGWGGYYWSLRPLRGYSQ